MTHDLVTVSIGHPRYEELIGRIRADDELRAQMWADAEHVLTEQLGKLWTVVSVQRAGRWEPQAWAAARVDAGVLRCTDNYERRGPGRDHGLYRVAYAHRHHTIVYPCRLPALTYLFAEPIALHEADGWRRTGNAGVSDHGHHWWELLRPA